MTERPHEDLHRDIEEARHDLGDTVAALAAKADVKKRAKAHLAQTTTQLKTTAKQPKTIAATTAVAASATALWFLRRRLR